MLSNYEKAINLLNTVSNLPHMPYPKCPCSVEEVKIFEEALKIKLPQDFIRFSTYWGNLSVGGLELFGVNTYDLQTILEEQESWGMPKNLLMIHELGYGTQDCLQINETDPDKSPVVEYHDPDSPVRVLAPDFGTFLLDLVQQEIQYQRNERNKG